MHSYSVKIELINAKLRAVWRRKVSLPVKRWGPWKRKGTIKSVGQTRAVGARVCDPQQFRQAERLGRNGTVRLSEVLRLTEPYSLLPDTFDRTRKEK
jgi:hypothetical protein